VGNVSTNVYAMFRCALPRIKKALGILRELITRRRTTTTVAFWDPPSGSKNVVESRHDMKEGITSAVQRETGHHFATVHNM